MKLAPERAEHSPLRREFLHLCAVCKEADGTMKALPRGGYVHQGKCEKRLPQREPAHA
jgi:hypothetical protein